jgi:hypothetical protein
MGELRVYERALDAAAERKASSTSICEAFAIEAFVG